MDENLRSDTKDINGIPITVEEVKENTPAQQKTFYSRWHLLVNSNVRGDNLGRSNDIAEILKSSVKCVFHEHATKVFKCKYGKFEAPNIEDVKIKMAAEIGTDPKGKRVHVHVLIDVTHHDVLQIDVPEMRRDLKECMDQRDPDLPFPFIRLKWVPVNQALEKYIGKAPVGW